MVWYHKTRWTKAKKTKVGDREYDSKFEASYAYELTLEKAAKRIKDFTPQYQIDLVCNGYKVGTYKVDFWVNHNDGSVELVETKGYATNDWKWRWKILETMVSSNPLKYFGNHDVKMTVIKQGKQLRMRRPIKI
jgi:hypothetical protein